jgi:hypothetical protein
MEQQMTGGIGDYLDRKHVPYEQTGDDMLDPGTVDRIEELHAAVLVTEAERRFGRRHTGELGDAQDEERAFLNAHGFATYNDYRLRIRRSVADTEPALPVPEAASTGPVATSADAGAVAAPAEPVASAPAVGGHTTEVAPVLVDDSVLRSLTGPWIAELKRELDRYLEARVEAADAQADNILSEASRRADDVVTHATQAFDVAEALLRDVTALVGRLAEKAERVVVTTSASRAPLGSVAAALHECLDKARALEPANAASRDRGGSIPFAGANLEPER